MTGAANPRAVMVIYGHDKAANDALFDWLRAIGLQPLEWRQLVGGSGTASPYIGQVLDHAFEQAQAVVAFFTPDEHVIGSEVAAGDKAWRLQARPNVLIEAGMALVSHPDRTIFVVLGGQELPSDLGGRHYIRLRKDDPVPLHELATRLTQAGCATDLTGADWLRPSRFPDRDQAPKAGDLARAPAPVIGTAQPRPPAPGPPSHAAPARPYRLVHTLIGHTGRVYGVAFNPDGSWLVTAGADGTTRRWDPLSGDQMAPVAHHGGTVYGVAFSPDGNLLATAREDGVVRLFDDRKGGVGGLGASRSLQGHTGEVLSVAFSPDGSALASTSADRTARIWDVATGVALHELSLHKGQVNRVAFSPDGTLVATTSRDKQTRLSYHTTGKMARSLTGHTGGVYGVAFSPSGDLLATASADNTARLWDPATGDCVAVLSGHTAQVFGVAFRPDGALLATVSADKSVRLWDPVTRQCVRILTGHTDAVHRVAFSPDGTRLATTGRDSTARIWSYV